MKFPDRMALDRALLMLPMCPEREAIVGALLDDGGEYGFFPRYQSLKTVGDLRRTNSRGMKAPILQEISPETFAWVFAQFDAPEPTPTPAIEDGAGAHALTHDDDPAQLLPILDLIVQEGGKSHANFGDRLARLDLPYLQMIRFQDAVAKIVIDANHYDKVGALLREPDVRMVRAKVEALILAQDAKRNGTLDASEGTPPSDALKTATGELDRLIKETEHLTSGDRYKRSFETILPPEPDLMKLFPEGTDRVAVTEALLRAAPTTDQIVGEIRSIIRDSGSTAAEDWDEAKDLAEVVMAPKRPKTPKGKAGGSPSNQGKKISTPKMGALADVLKDI